MRLHGEFLVACIVVAGGCAGPRRPSVDDVGEQCQATPPPRGEFETLLVEWSVEEKTQFESAFGRGQTGGLAVRYTGCEMDVLPQCRVLTGTYDHAAVSPKRRRLQFDDRRSVYAKAPLGAVSIMAELGRGRHLVLESVTVGRYTMSTSAVMGDILDGECDGVTHVVTGVTTGAYSLETHAARGGRVEASSQGIAGGVASKKGTAVSSADGDPEECLKPYGGGRAACNALLSVSLRPVEDPERSRARSECPAGTVFVPSGRREQASTYSDDWNMPNYEGGFCIDVEEVKTRDYARCVRSETCPDMPTTVTDGVAASLGLSEAAADEMCVGRGPGTHAQDPVNCVDWRAARAYCDAQGARLPKQEEWQWVATGAGQGRDYPWGQDPPTPAHANFCNKECAKADFWASEEAGDPARGRRRDGAVALAPGGRYGKGDGRYGIHDLAGNVAEWTQDGTIVGGSFLSMDDSELSARHYEQIEPSTRRPDVGFRCVRDPK